MQWRKSRDFIDHYKNFGFYYDPEKKPDGCEQRSHLIGLKVLKIVLSAMLRILAVRTEARRISKRDHENGSERLNSGHLLRVEPPIE